MNRIKYALIALATLVAAAACTTKEFDEITDLNLSRCLAPMNLEARVSSALGDVVTFSWDVSKDAEAYNLMVFTDAECTQLYLSETILPSQVPYQKKLEADKTFSLNIGGNVAYNQNRVIDLGGLKSITAQSYWASTEIGDDYIVEVGQPLGNMYGYVTDGMYSPDEFSWNGSKWVLNWTTITCLR